MRTPRTLALALIGTAALAFSPAFAGDQPKSEQVQIEIDLDASLEDKIRAFALKPGLSAARRLVANIHPRAMPFGGRVKNKLLLMFWRSSRAQTTWSWLKQTNKINVPPKKRAVLTPRVFLRASCPYETHFLRLLLQAR